MAYDSKCLELARYFLEGRVPGDVLEGMSRDLAQSIQDTVEDFDCGSAAVTVKRMTRDFSSWDHYKRGVQNTVDALRAGIAGLSEGTVPKADILKFCEFTEKLQREDLAPPTDEP